jgi:Bacterial membrane protein YfhO
MSARPLLPDGAVDKGRLGRGRFSQSDRWCFLAVIGVVLLANAIPLLGIVDTVPYDNRVGLITHRDASSIRGRHTIDPNDGFTAEALGRAAAVSWTHGQVPYWNHFEGLGAPLAGEMQSGAFSPFVLLLLFRNGLLYLHVVLEIIAGIATFLFIRRLGLHRLPALVAGALFALNGTHAWLTNAVFAPVAFLPVILLGVEHAFVHAQARRRGGLVALSLGLALSLLAGFPEVAFIDGLLVALWCVVRAFDVGRASLLAFARKLVTGVVLGAAIAAPIIVAFTAFLNEANVGGHSGALSEVHLKSAYMFTLVFPYAAGTIFGSFAPESQNFWGSAGGYLGASSFVMAILGLRGREWRRAKVAVTIFWLAVVLRIFGISHLLTKASNLIPGINQTAFYRYSSPALSFATVTLVAFGLQGFYRVGSSRLAFGALALVSVAILGSFAIQARNAVRLLTDVPTRHPVAVASVGGAALLAGAVLVLAAHASRSDGAVVVAGIVLVVEACLLFMVPEVSAPRNVRLDRSAVRFLRENLGTQRFFSVGPITPNYGSYLGIAQLNVNDLPTPAAWDRFAARDLNPNSNPQLLTGFSPLDSNGPDGFAAFAAHTAGYLDAGVKYLVLGKGMSERVDKATLPASLVFENDIVDIYELRNPAPYFSAAGCELGYNSRNRVTASCTAPSVMRRSELVMAGWSATVNGKASAVGVIDDRYQTVNLPQGTSTVAFDFSPPHARLSWLAFAVAVVLLAAGSWRAKRSGNAGSTSHRKRNR